MFWSQWILLFKRIREFLFTCNLSCFCICYVILVHNNVHLPHFCPHAQHVKIFFRSSCQFGIKLSMNTYVTPIIKKLLKSLIKSIFIEQGKELFSQSKKKNVPRNSFEYDEYLSQERNTDFSTGVSQSITPKISNNKWNKFLKNPNSLQHGGIFCHIKQWN